ncbi:MAG: ArnT family glycosyltransferase [Anaerolineales bacterium]
MLNNVSATERASKGRISRTGRLLNHWAALFIVFCYLVLACYYSVTIPIWEAFDEAEHYAYARYLATYRTIPRPEHPEAQLLHEKFQPPLYYSLGASILYWTRPIPEPHYQRNPHLPDGTGGHNYAIHPPEQFEEYLRRTWRVYLVRLLSIVIGGIGVVFTYRAALLLFHPCKEWALAAMALYAFWPQFLFHSGVISNDILSATMGTLLVYVLVQALVGTIDDKVLLEMGALSFLALLTKVNTSSVVLVVYISVIIALFSKDRRRELSLTPRWLLVSLAAVSLPGLAGWVIYKLPYVRIPVIGTPGESLSIVFHSRTDRAISESTFFRTLLLIVRKAYVTYFASFGWGTISVRPIFYTISGIMVVLCLIVTLMSLPEKDRARRMVLIACFLIIAGVLGQLIALNIARRTLGLAVGRYLLPCATAFCLLVSYGWGKLVSGLERFGEGLGRLLGHGYPVRIMTNLEWLRHSFLFLPMIALFLISLLIPSFYLKPAYARPVALSPQEVERIPNPVFYDFGHRMALIGFEIPTDGFQPGETEEVTLYWRGLESMSTDYSLDIQILDAEKNFYGAARTYPGQGTFPSSLWPPNQAFRDTYRISIGDDLPTPGMAHIKVVVYNRETHERLDVFDAQGTPLGQEAFLGRIRTYSVPTVQRPPDEYLALYGESIALHNYEMPPCIAGEKEITATLEWVSHRPVEKDYTVFVHLVDEKGTVLAQDDGEPRGGRYPTSLWMPHDTVIDERNLTIPRDLPAGPYRVLIGLYRPDTIERLPAQDQSGQPLPAEQFVIEGIHRCPQTRALADELIAAGNACHGARLLGLGMLFQVPRKV